MLFALNSLQNSLIRLRSRFIHIRHINQRLRKLREIRCQLFKALAGPHNLICKTQCSQSSVAGRRKSAIDNMSRLFAAERITAAQHFLENITISHGSLDSFDSHVPQRQFQPEIAHHRHDKRIILKQTLFFV